MSKIYLASRYARRAEMEEYARRLTELGFEITSNWVYGDRDIVGSPGNTKQFATMDRFDLLRADLVINFAEPKELDYPRGSRHTEFGMAYERGKVCYIVGIHGIELENIFHNLEGVVVFESWDDLYPHLQQLAIYVRAKATMEVVANGAIVNDLPVIRDPGHPHLSYASVRVKFELTVTYENDEDAEERSERVDRFEDALEIPSDLANDEKLGFNRRSFGETIFTLYVMTFAKGMQYGNSWQKRGEIRGPISNMDRKYDRVMNSIDKIESGGKNDPYPRIDGSADLAVYALLYLSTFLREHYPAAFERWWKDEVQGFLDRFRPFRSLDTPEKVA